MTKSSCKSVFLLIGCRLTFVPAPLLFYEEALKDHDQQKIGHASEVIWPRPNSVYHQQNISLKSFMLWYKQFLGQLYSYLLKNMFSISGLNLSQ